VNNIIDGANNAFSFTILRQSVGAGHAKMDALSEEELPGARVVELEPVVTLDNLDACAELSGGVGDEVSERVECVRFEAQRKSPQIMSAIIKNDQIIFITRNADNWRGP
jgi:hypothetical protein